MKKLKIAFWISTVLLCIIPLFSASMYFTKYEMIAGFFELLGYPTYIIYPLAILKIIAVIVLLINKGIRLKEWVYAGLFFNFTLAFFAHVMINDGAQGTALIGLLLLASTYILNRFIDKKKFNI
ncbi:DoxX family protein [Aureivirga marina]|uniref:DoxX family protein n=1 Tax=Aureivirga marina TaxID=1182451 RepID=UPI0018C99E32|nr:DoxX family protein [Aureivirga marina]